MKIKEAFYLISKPALNQLDYNIYWMRRVLRFFYASLINSRKYTNKEPVGRIPS
ncbi:hypothetical protein QUF81_17055 [Peribacillus simplex]|uniref:Uncharacterized protein n=1 Tax=Peribacillus simplex TaxID=1478 RepID=A0AAW7IQB5_9BACI|nr:hypothetical protein [Peribacillus simplex]MDM5294856.1 hypothetical protein [Peribacillus simplex]MDM5453812.1 hypothetical protein [Peribacillus simplex]